MGATILRSIHKWMGPHIQVTSHSFASFSYCCCFWLSLSFSFFCPVSFSPFLLLMNTATVSRTDSILENKSTLLKSESDSNRVNMTAAPATKRRLSTEHVPDKRSKSEQTTTTASASPNKSKMMVSSERIVKASETTYRPCTYIYCLKGQEQVLMTFPI